MRYNMTPTSPYTQLKPVLISICCPCPPLMIMMRRRRRRQQWWHATGPWNHLFFPVEPHPHSGFACKQLLLLQHLPFPKGRCIRQVFWADHVSIFPDICEFHRLCRASDQWISIVCFFLHWKERFPVLHSSKCASYCFWYLSSTPAPKIMS